MSDCDLIVLGGGPAGAATAVAAAHDGLRVILLERDASPRHRPGETLHPGVQPLFETLGAWERVAACDFVRHEGTWVEWGTTHRFERFSSGSERWRGFQGWRSELDAALRAEAVAAGVSLICPARGSRPIVKGSRVVGVTTSNGVFRAPWFVDAAGGSHWLARRLGIEVQQRSPRLFARYGYAAGACPSRDAAPRIVSDTNGWSWTARVRPGLYAWTRLGIGKRTLHAAPAELEHLIPACAAGGADVTWRIAARTAGPGYFIVGDAAAVVDPASSHGVLRALMSGMLAARRISDVSRGKVSVEAATADYQLCCLRWFEHDLKCCRASKSAGI